MASATVAEFMSAGRRVKPLVPANFHRSMAQLEDESCSAMLVEDYQLVSEYLSKGTYPADIGPGKQVSVAAIKEAAVKWASRLHGKPVHLDPRAVLIAVLISNSGTIGARQNTK